MTELIRLQKGDVHARVNPVNGQLVGLSLEGTEYLHDGRVDSYDGKGWKNSEIVPYPIFGPAQNQKVIVGGRTFNLEQHGISRYLGFKVIRREGGLISLMQIYDGRKVINPKHKQGNEHPENLTWLPYQLEKNFELTEDGLVCKLTITNKSNIEMPYMIGWHPAFRTIGEIEEGLFFDSNRIIASLEGVINISSIPPEEALTIEGINSVEYRNKERGVRVSSEDFGNVMLWSPGREEGMFCIEHTSQLPLTKGVHFKKPENFERLNPDETKTYEIKITLL
ncbi:MAG: hypothetical protein AABX28_03280 [Nanoarchaeota archaeon]